VPAKRGYQNPVGQWNEEEIIAVGRHIKVKLNGVKIVDADLDDVKDPEVLKKHPGLANKSGHIGFLGHGTRVEFRNMRIKDLAPAPQKTSTGQAPGDTKNASDAQKAAAPAGN
jgi:hypothetical protein